MFSRSRRNRDVREPSSIYGRWLAANMLQRREQIHRYRAEIRERIPSGGGAQVSVAANLFRGLVVEEFSVDQNVREITGFVESFIDTLSERNHMDALKVEALIRSTLGETTVFIEDIEFG